MLKKIMLASAAVMLLAACEQKPMAVAAPPLPPAVQKNYTVLFDTGKATLSTESVSTIAKAASAFKTSGARAVAVAGHTDTTGAPQFNLQLSQQRAAAVQAELQRDGVPGPAIAALGYGEQDLPVKTAQDVPEQRNRSVDITHLRARARGAHERYRLLQGAQRHIPSLPDQPDRREGGRGDEQVRDDGSGLGIFRCSSGL